MSDLHAAEKARRQLSQVISSPSAQPSTNIGGPSDTAPARHLRHRSHQQCPTWPLASWRRTTALPPLWLPPALETPSLDGLDGSEDDL